MRKFKINSAASVSPSQFENDVDEQFMQDVGSIITLEDGSSLDLNKAMLLYNPKTRQIQISDTKDIPSNFIQLATLNVTSQEPEVMDDESFEEFTPEVEEEMQEEPEAEEPRESNGPPEDSMGETRGNDSGDFFQ